MGENTQGVYIGLLDLEVHERVNKEAIWQVLRKYDVHGKLQNRIKSMLVNSLTCIGVKEEESEGFKIENGVLQGCITSSQIFNVSIFI